MIGAGKRIVIDLLRADPLKVNGTIQTNSASHIAAEKHIHDDFKMRIGVPDAGETFVCFHFEANLL